MKFPRVQTVLTVIAAVIPLALLAILLFLGSYAWPAIRFNGLGFLFKLTWNLGNLYANPVTVAGQVVPRGAQYGILVFIAGTLLSSAIALLLAVPLSIGIAVFLTEAVGGTLRELLSFVVELLAGVPSVVYGLWGYAVLIPLVAHQIGPFLRSALGFLPVFAGSVGSGYGLLTAGLVLALMVVPIIASTLRDALLHVPIPLKEGAYALGATHHEVVREVMLPAVRSNLVAASILGLGRALGETMAVLMVSGGALNYLPHNIYSPVTTMAAFILSQLDSALTDPTGMAVRSLAEIAVVLFLISLLVNLVARLLIWQTERRSRVAHG
jgi:phosphate transport system permease protein